MICERCLLDYDPEGDGECPRCLYMARVLDAPDPPETDGERLERVERELERLSRELSALRALLRSRTDNIPDHTIIERSLDRQQQRAWKDRHG